MRVEISTVGQIVRANKHCLPSLAACAFAQQNERPMKKAAQDKKAQVKVKDLKPNKNVKGGRVNNTIGGRAD